MALSGVYDAAKSGLSVFSKQMGLVARNVENANDPSASRKLARVTVASGGEALFAGVERVEESALQEASLSATSQASSASVELRAVSNLDSLAGGIGANGNSPVTLIGGLSTALKVLASQPASEAGGSSVVSAARSLAQQLNDSSAEVTRTREQADQNIADAVSSLNDKLSRFEKLNRSIVVGTQAGTDVTDALDERDKLLASIADDVGIRAVPRASGAMAIYTDGGITLFESTARSVEFSRVPLTPGASGGAVLIDGVPATGAGQPMALRSGAIAGNVAVRDEIAPRYETQLDEIARGLVEAFSETDQTNSGAPARPGLFTFAGAASTPPAGTAVLGLARSIEVNTTVDPEQGGDWRRIRDGGAAAPGNPAYIYNASGAAGFSDRVRALDGALSQKRPFSSAAGLSTSASVTELAQASVGWLSQKKSSASDLVDQRTALRERASTALQSATGVNLDQEMAHMLELERSYQASTRLITVADSMLQTLLQSVG